MRREATSWGRKILNQKKVRKGRGRLKRSCKDELKANFKENRERQRSYQKNVEGEVNER